MSTANDVYTFLVAYMNKFAGPYSGWYAGITADPRDRLFSGHNVSEADGNWAYKPAATSDDARSAEQALFKLGCDGGPGGGDNTTKIVYVYRKTANSIE